MIALDWQCSNSPGRVSPHCKDLTIKSSLWLTITPSVRCSDAAGANPEWRVNNRTDNTNLATLRLMGPGFAVISINWHRVEAESVELQCLTPACRLTGRLRRARPSSTTSTSTTSTTSRPTTASTRGEAEQSYLELKFACSRHHHEARRADILQLPAELSSHRVPGQGEVEREAGGGPVVQHQL